MELKEITRTVISYCDLPQEMTEDSSMSEHGTDCYIELELLSADRQKGYDDNFDITNYILEQHPELTNAKVLIHIDY